MGSFRKQKNWILRLGVPLLFVAINILGTFVPSVLSFISNPSVSADATWPAPANPGENYFVVRRAGVSDDGSKYTVVAVPKVVQKGFASSLSFTYHANGSGVSGDTTPGYLSDSFTWQADPASCNSGTNPNIQASDFYTFTIYAASDTAHTGKTYGSGTFNGCGNAQINHYQLVTINASTIGQGGQSVGSVDGTITFVSQVDGKTQTFGSATQGAKVTLTSPTGQTIQVITDSKGHYHQDGLAVGKYLLNGSYTNPLASDGNIDGKTYFIDKDTPITVTAGNTVNGSAVAKTGTAVVTTPVGSTVCADGSDPDSNGNCATQLDCGSGALNWIVCAVIDAAKSASGVLDNMITNTLNTDVTTIFDTKTSGCSTANPCVQNGYYTAWNSFRIIATSLVVIAGLVMVVAQAMGFEILDAYTLRKVIPRMGIAIIGMSLSWPIMRWVVQGFDTLGFDVRNLIYAPFAHLGGTINFATGALTWIAAGAGVFLLGPATLSFLVTAFFAVLIGFLVLIFRQLAIIVLIIVAPVAIAFYILPNTQKLWKLWYDNFLALMLAFPIISAVIAAGHVFAAVSIAKGGTLGQVEGLLFYFIVYGIIPLLVRLAGGVTAQLAGIANDRGRGIFDRQKKKRQAAMADRIGRAQGENLYSKDTRRGRVGNKLASLATAPGANIAYAGRNKIPGLKRAGSRIESQIEHARVEQSGKAFETLNKMGYNDKAYRALSGIHRDLSAETQGRLANAGLLNKAPATMKEVQEMGRILSLSSGETERIGGNAITGSAGYLGNLYKDPEMGKASLQAAGIMGLAAHGFADGEDLAGAGNALMGGTFVAAKDEEGNAIYKDGKLQGTYDGGKMDHHQAAFSQAIISQAQMLGARSRPDTKPGYGVVYNSGSGRWVDGMSAEGGRAAAVIKTLSSHDLAGAKGGAIAKLAPTIKQIMIDGNGPNANPTQIADARAVQDQLFSWAGPYSQASVDVKTQALGLIDELNNGVNNDAGVRIPDFKTKFERYARSETDETLRGGSRPEDPAATSGGTPGGGGPQ